MTSDSPIRQLLYASIAVRREDERIDLEPIFEASRHNNAIDGVTGLLYADRTRFLQVLEGPDASVEDTMARIRQDPRHEHIVVLRDETVDARQFGYWSMAARQPNAQGDSFDERMARLLMSCSPDVRDAFMDLVVARNVG